MMQIYVGTYHKYNCGSIAGKWLAVEDYSDKGEFLEACKQLHADETDPEYMFQDFEGIPERYISESHVKEELWDEYAQLCEADRETCRVYWEHIDDSLDAETVMEYFRGIFDSVEDYAYELVNDCYDLEKSMGSLASYFDYKSFARDLELGGDICTARDDGSLYIFSNN